jgi:hypothetical protein
MEESKNYNKVKNETPLNIQIKVLEDINKKQKSHIDKLEKQLILSSVTFCLLTEKDKTFEDWVHNNFNKQGNCFVNKINETVTYSQDALLDLYDFYCDRFIAK